MEDTENTEETQEETQEPAKEAEVKAPESLLGERPNVETEKEAETTDKPKEKANHDNIDKRLFKETGEFDADGAKEVFDEWTAEKEKYEKRIVDMRRMVSTKDDFVEKKEEFYQDFAPTERFDEYFS